MAQATRQEDIWIEQILLLRKQLPVMIGGGFLTAAIVTVGLRPYLETTQLFIWMALVSVVTLIRLLHMRYWLRGSVDAENVRAQIHQITSFSFISGLLWGVFGVMILSQHNLPISLTAVMVLTGMVASATAALSHFKWAYLAFIIPTMLPTAIVSLFFEELLYNLIALGTVLHLIVNIKFSRGIRDTIIQSITLRFENHALVDSLQEEKAHAVTSMQAAKRANLAKSRFMAAASHDLRQPLCALRLYTATLQMLGNNDKQEEIAKNIDTSVVALEELFDSLLDISKLDAGTLEVKKENFNLTAILDRIVVDFSAVAAEKNIKLNINTEKIVVFSDPQLLERLLRNLVSNAVRYTDQGGVHVRSVNVDKGDTVRIEVLDTGCGISTE
ncbi:HAMP domain-containing histidine kinase, partial [bacterium]|nr:HAMP domain-containing histidine kinase [bacterium]